MSAAAAVAYHADGFGTARGRALTAVCGVLFLTFLDTTIISVALGSVQSDLHAGVTALQWVVNAYALVFASLMLTVGSLGDRWGRKKIMLAGIVLFCAGSVLGALAPNVAVLIGARALMGVGAAASEPGTLSMIRHLYPESATRSRALGVWAAVSGLALALGPVLGGVLVGIGSWRNVFWFNLAVGVLLVVAVVRWVPESADAQSGGVDLAGFVLVSGFLGCGIFAVIYGETSGYGTDWIIALFVLSGVSLLGFVVAELRARQPMLNLAYLRNPGVSGPLVVAFAIYFGIFSIFFFTALYLEEVVGYSGYRTAAQFGFMAGAMVIGSLAAGRWVGRRGARPAMTIGCVLGAVGIALTEHYITAAHPFGPLSLSLAIAGAGFGIAVVPVTSAVLTAIPPEHSGMAASAANTVRQVGAVVGVAVLGSLVNSHLTADLSGRLRALGIPANFQSIVIGAIEHGTVSGGSGAAANYGQIVNQVIDAAYSAFRAGLSVALWLSAAMMLGAAVIAALTVNRSSKPTPTSVASH